MIPAESTALCRTCGMPLPGGKWSSACPRCLIEAFSEEEKPRTADGFAAGYTILEEVARGGMGVVHRAQQHRPSRIVALKRIVSFQANPQETVLRFRREAEAIAALDHPNILPIYEVNESEDGFPFFSMKFATGGSLREAAPALQSRPNECAGLIAKVARAVAHAHENGILHRDLQPGNILLDGNGEPLVSDFGLAKWLDHESDLTRTLTAFGTPGYIAPEQAEGAELTPAADVYSLGAILFNLLAHRPPFVGTTVLSVIHQAAASPAPRLRSLVPGIDRDLETIVARCLEREPQARYQSARALAEDLERWLAGRPILARHARPATRIWRWSRRNPYLAAAATTSLVLAFALAWLVRDRSAAPSRVPAPAKSIAVLPFANLSGDPENAWFAEGVVDGILARLSKIAALKVISRSSTQRFQSAPGNIREIARQLGVQHILEGRVRKSGETVRMTVQLTHAPSQTNLWTETYDRKSTDLFQVESEIAQCIAAALATTLTGREQRAIQARQSTNVAAHHAYLKGRYFWNKRMPESYKEARDYFQQAVTLDPTYASAYAGLSDAYQFLATTDVPSRRESFAKAREAARKAIELDDTLAAPHASLGLIAMNHDWDWAKAEQEFRRAIELDSNYATAHQWYAEYLMAVGRFDEGLAAIKRARELDPLSMIINADTGKFLYFARRYEDAIQQLQETMKMDPAFLDTQFWLGAVYTTTGRYEEAIREFEKFREPSRAWTLTCLGYVYGVSGRREEAERILPELKQLTREGSLDPQGLRYVYMALGKTEETFAMLEQEYEVRSTGLISLKTHPWYDSIRSDPRFPDLLRRMKLAP